MANAPVKIWRKFSQYAIQILDFTLNMPHEILGPVAPPHPKRSGVHPPGTTFMYMAFTNVFRSLSYVKYVLHVTCIHVDPLIMVVT